MHTSDRLARMRLRFYERESHLEVYAFSPVFRTTWPGCPFLTHAGSYGVVVGGAIKLLTNCTRSPDYDARIGSAQRGVSVLRLG
jgi:hypothetical protein